MGVNAYQPDTHRGNLVAAPQPSFPRKRESRGGVGGASRYDFPNLHTQSVLQVEVEPDCAKVSETATHNYTGLEHPSHCIIQHNSPDTRRHRGHTVGIRGDSRETQTSNPEWGTINTSRQPRQYACKRKRQIHCQVRRRRLVHKPKRWCSLPSLLHRRIRRAIEQAGFWTDMV